MSQELPSNKSAQEEVDLIVFFNLIGNAINKLFSFVASIFKYIFTLTIHSIKVVIEGWKVILSVIIISSIIGFGLEKVTPPIYQSEMLVKPYFESKYQLVNNIGYFNALISNKEYKELDEIFNGADSANKVDVKDISEFIIESGPETENDRIKQYQDFKSGLDSFGREQVDYEKFLDNRSIYSGNVFLITAKSPKKAIFKNLTYGVSTAFTNDYSTSRKKKDTLLYKIQRENIENSLEQVEKLQEIYIKALQDQAQNQGQAINVGELFFSKEKDVDTKEYALLDKELALRDKLRKLEEKRITEDVFVDVITSFQPVGHTVKGILERYSIVFPVLGFLLLCVIYFTKRIVIYTMNYED